MPEDFRVVVVVPGPGQYGGAENEDEAVSHIHHMLNGCYPSGEVVYHVYKRRQDRRPQAKKEQS